MNKNQKLRDIKLSRIIKTLSISEMKRVEKFLKSPFFVRSDKLLNLFLFYKKYYPDFNQKGFTNEKAYKAVYPKKIYNSKEKDNLLHKLLKLIEEFLIVTTLKKEEHTSDLLLMKAWATHGLEEQLERKSKRLEEDIFANKFITREDYQLIQANNHLLFFHPKTMKYKKAVASLDKAESHLDNAYVLSKLIYLCERLTMAITVDAPIDKTEYQLLINPQKRNEYKSRGGLFAIYTTIIELYIGGESQQIYEKLQTIVMDEKDEIPFAYLRNIHQHITNYGIRAYNSGTWLSFEKMIDIYEFGIDNNLIDLSSSYLLNVALTIISAKEFERAQQFLEKYLSTIKEEEQDITQTIVDAYIHFNKNNFLKVIQLLEEITTKNVTFLIHIKTLALRSAYELQKKGEDIFDKIDSNMKYFLRTNDDLDFKKRIYVQNFRNFLFKLDNLSRIHYPKVDKIALEKELMDMSSILVKEWLLAKVREL